MDKEMSHTTSYIVGKKQYEELQKAVEEYTCSNGDVVRTVLWGLFLDLNRDMDEEMQKKASNALRPFGLSEDTTKEKMLELLKELNVKYEV